jgi:hypothetical protein
MPILRPLCLTVDAEKPHIRPSTKEYGMASRQIKMPAKDDSEKEVEEVFSQNKQDETLWRSHLR